MKKIYLHIGMSKTGTTAIQYFLHNNRDKLPQLDYGYINPANDSAINHSPLVNCLKGASNLKKDQKWIPFLDQLFESKPNNLIISSENLFYHTRALDLDYLATALRGFSVKILIYLRRQDEWVQSQYAEYVKYCTGKPGAISLGQWLARNMDRCLDYYDLLKIWRMHFPEADFNVRIYEKRFFGDDIINDFCLAVGLSDTSILSKDLSPSQKNISLSYEAVEMKRLFNKIEIPKHLNSTIVNILKQASAFQRQLSDGSKRSLLSSLEKLYLIEKYKNSNSMVAKEFLGAEELFLNPLPDLAGDEDDVVLSHDFSMQALHFFILDIYSKLQKK